MNVISATATRPPAGTASRGSRTSKLLWAAQFLLAAIFVVAALPKLADAPRHGIPAHADLSRDTVAHLPIARTQGASR